MKKINFHSLCFFAMGIILLFIPKYRDYKSSIRTQKIIQEIEEKQSTVVEKNGEPVEIGATSGVLILSDKISLKMPITEGATFENMIDSVATIGSNEIINGKNLAIAGHRYIRKGKHFNRLDELEQGDSLTIVDSKGQDNEEFICDNCDWD